MRNLFLFLLLSISIHFQAQLLYQITGKNVKSPSYILGTQSLIPAKALDSIQSVYKAFNKCNVVIGNYNAYSAEAEGSLKRAAMLPLSRSINNYISDSAYKNIDIELKRVLKFGLKEVGLMHPAMIRQLYLSELFNSAVNLSDDAQTDSYFQMVASIKGIEVVGLENYTSYLNSVFDPAKIQPQALQLVNDVNNAGIYKTYFRDLLHYYNTSDIQKISNLLNQIGNKIAIQDVEKSFSANKIQRIKEWINTNSCFIVVDVLQLNGENGIISQLQKAGYNVSVYPSKKEKKRK
ncbi:MAG: TraB/GumN family protein [Paludibacter sp.]